VLDDNKDLIFDPRGWRTPEGGWISHGDFWKSEIAMLKAKANFIERFAQTMDDAAFWFGIGQ